MTANPSRNLTTWPRIFSGFISRERLANLSKRHLVRRADGNGGDRVGNVVLPKKRQNELHIAVGVTNRKSGAFKSEILNLLYLERRA